LTGVHDFDAADKDAFKGIAADWLQARRLGRLPGRRRKLIIIQVKSGQRSYQVGPLLATAGLKRCGVRNLFFFHKVFECIDGQAIAGTGQ
jgi:hypothetical protein